MLIILTGADNRFGEAHALVFAALDLHAQAVAQVIELFPHPFFAFFLGNIKVFHEERVRNPTGADPFIKRLCTKLCPVEYDSSARSDLFDRVLADALPDESVRTYFQKVCGLTLIGGQVEDLIVFAHGPEATAKTTLFEPPKKLFGDYDVTVEPETLMHSFS